MKISNLSYIRMKDPKLAEALKSIGDAITQTATKVGVNPIGNMPAPSPVQAFTVTGTNGVFQGNITDNSPRYRALEYFAEYSTTAGFQTPRVIHLGASRTFDIFLGSGTLYWRAYSGYIDANVTSAPVYAAGNPVTGGGAIAGPSYAASTGSGTAASDGQQGGSGYGPAPFVPAPNTPGQPPTVGDT